jgi:ATP-dependent DNA helicase RecQ
VLSNATLDRLAHVRPQSSTELEEVSGIGPATMEQHGYDLLELIGQCLADQVSDDHEEGVDRGGEAEAQAAARAAATPASPEPVASEASANSDGASPETTDALPETEVYWTWRLFCDGYTLEEVCQIRRLNRTQVGQHVRAAQHRGRSVSPTWLA